MRRSLPLGRGLRIGRRVAVQARNQVEAPRFARGLPARADLPTGGVVLFFPSGPENLVCFEQWRRPLEKLSAQRPVFVVVSRPDTGKLVAASTSLPVAFARSSGELETLVGDRDVRVVLYTNQDQNNFRMLRFAEPVHIQLGHGESDKVYSASNQHKAYDFTFVGGEAGQQRLGHALRGFDSAVRAVPVGRPQLDQVVAGGPDWDRGGDIDRGLRVWYAPTWEGDRPSAAYGSLASHGVAMVEAMMADPAVRIIYRPHPRTGLNPSADARADRTIRELLRSAGDRHLVDHGAYGWQWRFADACITDISSVAYDWLATGKPLAITRPASPSASWPPSVLLDSLPLVAVSEAGQVLSQLRAMGLGDAHPESAARLAELSHYYFGETADGASTRRFEAAIGDALALADPGR
jgi:hypothetical protein